MFQAVKTNFEMSKILGAEIAEVDEIIKKKGEHIERISIPKKDGSKRKIIVPDSRLKYIQNLFLNRITLKDS